MNIFRARPEHRDILIGMCVTYSGEAKQGRMRPINLDKTAAFVDQYTSHPCCRAFLAFDGETPAGFIFASAHDFVYDTPDASIDIHYVAPAYRGSLASRLLLQMMLKELESAGVGDIYSASESGIDERNNRLFENLYMKQGFGYAGGRNMIRFAGGRHGTG